MKIDFDWLIMMPLSFLYIGIVFYYVKYKKRKVPYIIVFTLLYGRGTQIYPVSNLFKRGYGRTKQAMCKLHTISFFINRRCGDICFEYYYNRAIWLFGSDSL